MKKRINFNANSKFSCFRHLKWLGTHVTECVHTCVPAYACTFTRAHTCYVAHPIPTLSPSVNLFFYTPPFHKSTLSKFPPTIPIISSGDQVYCLQERTSSIGFSPHCLLFHIKPTMHGAAVVKPLRCLVVWTPRQRRLPLAMAFGH